MKYTFITQYKIKLESYWKTVVFGILEYKDTMYLCINPNMNLEHLTMIDIECLPSDSSAIITHFEDALDILRREYNNTIVNIIKESLGQRSYLKVSSYYGAGSVCYIKPLKEEELLELGCSF